MSCSFLLKFTNLKLFTYRKYFKEIILVNGECNIFVYLKIHVIALEHIKFSTHLLISNQKIIVSIVLKLI